MKVETLIIVCFCFVLLFVKGREGLFRVILAMLTLGEEEILLLDMEGMLKVGTVYKIWWGMSIRVHRHIQRSLQAGSFVAARGLGLVKRACS